MSKLELWVPSSNQIKKSLLYLFLQAVNSKFSIKINNYEELYEWSIKNREQFWNFWTEFSNFPFLTSPETTLISPTNNMIDETWFSGSKTNFVKKIMDYTGSETAIIAFNENGVRNTISRDQLNSLIKKIQSSLRALSLKKGDRVAGILPNTIETIAMFLGCASMGIIWSVCSPDFGVNAAVDRFSQINPTLFIVVNGYNYAGKIISMHEKNKAITAKINSIKKTVMIPFLTESSNEIEQDNVILWHNFLSLGKHNLKYFKIEPLDFNYPLYIVFSSGTTGKPKCIIHGHGGTLLQHLKEHQLHTDIHEGDKIFYFTTCAWMMWNWLVSVLASGAIPVLYDGSPFYPNSEFLWKMAEKEKITVFGTSPKYLSELFKSNYYPIEHFSLKSLKTLITTGSPLLSNTFEQVYLYIKKNIRLCSISGGTDIISCFVLGCPIKPVFKGEIQCRGLGMDVHFINDQGESLVDNKGELACRQGFPSMPVGFWNDQNNKRYKKAYFKNFDNIWCHGDYGKITKNGGVILYGRSDTTLNPGGVRIGTAEIYRQIDKINDIDDSLAVGLKNNGDEEIILFVILKKNISLNSSFINDIKKTIKKNVSPRHIPKQIIEVTNFPRTVNGKTSELAVKSIINGEKPSNLSVLANPEVLSEFIMLNLKKS